VRTLTFRVIYRGEIRTRAKGRVSIDLPLDRDSFKYSSEDVGVKASDSRLKKGEE